MEKKKQRLLMTVWLSVAALSRILYFFLAQGKAVDTYAYCANAIAGTGNAEPVLTSGLAYAYTETLSKLLGRLGGDLIQSVEIQTFLQIAWLVVLFFAIRSLWGELAGYVTGTILLVSPFVIQTINVIEPVNFFMLHWAIVLLLYSVFRSHTAKKGWYRSNTGELFLIFTGFYMGVVCTWNYLGFLLLAVMVYVLIQNQKVLGEKLWRQKNLDLEEKEQLMPVGSQGFILIAGMLVGMFATLMKYTGLTGWTILEQFFWWQDQFRDFPGRCQDVPAEMPVWIIIAFGLGIGSQMILTIYKQKRSEKREYEEILKKEEQERRRFEEIEPAEPEDDLKAVPEDALNMVDDEPENVIRAENTSKNAISTDAPQNAMSKADASATVSEENMGDIAMQDDYFTTADGRVVKFLDNPLPGPKKHIKREMDFEINDVNDIKPDVKAEDDFDFEVDSNSDFDFQ